MYATIRSDSQPYLFRYSQEPTASTTAPGPLSGREQRWLPGCCKNLSAEDIRQSVDEYRREIAKAQIVMFPGGFSAGDEPEGSAKFFATVFRNAVMKGRD